MILKGVKSEIDIKVEAAIRGDCGTVESVPFVATFRTMKQSERQSWRKSAAHILETGPAEWDQAEQVRKYLVGWKEFPTTTGESLEFNEENVSMVLDAVEYCDALYAGFLDMINGAAKPKNS